MSLRFTRPGGLSGSMQGVKDLADLSTNQLTAARAPGAAASEPIARPIDSGDMEANRQVTGDIAPLAGGMMPPTRATTADTPEQFSDRQRFLNARSIDQENVNAQNAMHFAETTAPAQQAQQMGDMARSASAGYQQPDMTGAFSDAQEHARSFAGNYTWDLMSDQGRGTVDQAILRLMQGGAA